MRRTIAHLGHQSTGCVAALGPRAVAGLQAWARQRGGLRGYEAGYEARIRRARAHRLTRKQSARARGSSAAYEARRSVLRRASWLPTLMSTCSPEAASTKVTMGTRLAVIASTCAQRWSGYSLLTIALLTTYYGDLRPAAAAAEDGGELLHDRLLRVMTRRATRRLDGEVDVGTAGVEAA
eukprot:scaffold59027_cov54-Phaeocystis_antarctica.AAC.4